MKLIFAANRYKYEIEAVAKLFFPARKFEFYYTEKSDIYLSGGIEGDYAIIGKDAREEGYRLYVKAVIGEKAAEKSSCVSKKMSDNELEFELSRLLYMALCSLTGITSEWGVLTGVRPVKRINKMLSDGYSEEQVFSELKNVYLTGVSKCRMAYDVAMTQRKFLKKLEESQGKSFGLYVSIPFCPTRCSYCSFISQEASGEGVKKLIPAYIENLCREISYTGEIAARLGLRPDAVYFGGGTPTVLSAAQLLRIMRTIADSFDLSELSEYTIEAGRPDTITEEKLCAVRENGCTRISVNPQSLNNLTLSAIGRSHTAEDFYAGFELARKLGFNFINADIIAGLPTDGVQSFEATVDGLIALSPENITVHTLSIKRSARLNLSGKADDALKNPAGQMVKYASERLYANGYKPYYLYRQKNMVDNLENIGWAKPGFECLYNIYIMEEAQTILAVGAAASTKLVDMDNSRIERIFNFKYPLEYNKHFDLMMKRKKKIEDFYNEKKRSGNS